MPLILLSVIVPFIFAFLCSIFFALILTFFFKRHAPGPFNGMLYFFAIVFLFTVAVGVWVSDLWVKMPWVSIVATGLLITLLMAEMLPHRETKMVRKKKGLESEDEEDEEVLEKEFGVLAWAIVIGLIVAIVIGALYLNKVIF